MFKRARHQRIQKLLDAIDPTFLLDAECYFGGGTAIALALGEYRESDDVDFLCASPEGYRSLRNAIDNATLGKIFQYPMELAREVRADRYGIRTFVRVDGVPVKLEIVSEGRIAITGNICALTGVPTLCKTDMFAEKLLANADRYGDRSAASRDIIDVAMMIEHWGDIPAEAWTKVRNAYGTSVNRAFDRALTMLSNENYLTACLAKMHMDLELLKTIPALLQRGRNDA